MRPEFVIWAPAYRDDVGGIIALYELCDRLNRLGAPAAIWPRSKPLSFNLRAWLGYYLKGGWRGPTARRRDLKTAVVVYPEIVAGNPLDSSKVVRWLLYTPGLHTGTVDFGRNDPVFYYGLAFKDREAQSLRISRMIPDYRQANFGERSGSAVIVRKGAGRSLTAHPADAVDVDEMPHAERAAVFNRVERLYCYDPHTFHCVYAALCGCVPIVIPEPGVSEEAWQPDPRLRLGIAYGEDRIGWAIETRPGLLTFLEQSRAKEDDEVRAFIETCRRRFGTP